MEIEEDERPKERNKPHGTSKMINDWKKKK